MKQSLAPIIANLEVTPGTHLIRLKAPEIAASARPGQFIMVHCGQDTLLRRPLSIHQVDGSEIAMLFTVVGKGTHRLSQCQKGGSLNILGPLGNGFRTDPATKNLLLVAGGIGIAPLYFLADRTLRQGTKVTLLMGARSAVHLLPVVTAPDLFNKGVLPSSINVVTATDDGSEGFKGPVTDLISAYIDYNDQVFACGPVGMYRTMAQMPELKNKPAQISLEIMMGCGVGVCYGCTIKTRSGLRQVCRDGPVFDLADIIWEELSEI